jgi:hypothetical protein
VIKLPLILTAPWIWECLIIAGATTPACQVMFRGAADFSQCNQNITTLHGNITKNLHVNITKK